MSKPKVVNEFNIALQYYETFYHEYSPYADWVSRWDHVVVYIMGDVRKTKGWQDFVFQERAAFLKKGLKLDFSYD